MPSWFSTLLVFVLLSTTGAVRAAEPEALRVMTFNIRHGTAPDGENAWYLRKEQVFSVIRNFRPHLLGLQEALPNQLEQLAGEFPNLVALGTGREADGSGEYSALLFDRTRLDCFESGMFWLSDTPSERGSRTWGNHLPRICCWAEFSDRATQRTLRVYNNHWDHKSQKARVGSGELVAERIEPFIRQMPVLLMGDFNAGSHDPSRQPLADVGLVDTYFQVHNDEAETGTHNSFRGDRSGPKIDTIYVNDRFETISAAIDHTEHEGHFPSDHFPVTATLRFVEQQ